MTKPDLNEIYEDENESIEDSDTEQPQSKKKHGVTTPKEVEKLKFSDNHHLADLQQRMIRLEYEVLYIKDKLFEKSRTENQPKLSPYGKLVKRRIQQNG